MLSRIFVLVFFLMFFLQYQDRSFSLCAIHNDTLCTNLQIDSVFGTTDANYPQSLRSRPKSIAVFCRENSPDYLTVKTTLREA